MWKGVEITPGLILAGVLAFCGAVATIYNACEKIANVIKIAKGPNAAQNQKIAEIEAWKNGELREWQQEVDRKLNRDKAQLDSIQEGLRASYQAQLALLDHGIDGNNIKQMQEAKEALQNHLINHK